MAAFIVTVAILFGVLTGLRLVVLCITGPGSAFRGGAVSIATRLLLLADVALVVLDLLQTAEIL